MDILFDTPRLIFREFNETDAHLVYELNSDPQVTKYLHEPIVSEELAKEVLHSIILPQYKENNYGRWAVYLKNSKEFIGWCGLKKRSEREFPDLGYRFMTRYWGNGYATEAALQTLEYGFKLLQLKGIFAAAHIDNVASWKILEKCGMEFTGFQTIDNTPTRTYTKLNPYNSN